MLQESSSASLSLNVEAETTRLKATKLAFQLEHGMVIVAVVKETMRITGIVIRLASLVLVAGVIGSIDRPETARSF